VSLRVFSRSLRTASLVALVLLAYGSSLAVEPVTVPTAAEQLKQLNDQTIISDRLSLGSDWSQF